ncbi:MAG TPA: tetratricopeptide repeat protein [Terriglobales bacterium]|nr:tetratricopeptide repeat protein [Terriglobales bacterium]
MAFGFGFNKQKVLSAAEKFVQQGKLQNAIAEYDKILKHDANDLTVNNTIGDLYARLGDNAKAIECFKVVGDAYAAQGFTVKGIAMYKKITKLSPSVDGSLKLAELYTQQGLFNDARAQYLQVAEDFMKNGDLDQAVRLFQKVLEMDPENVPMRVKLAEVYIRLGKKKEAWEIFSAAAEALRARGSLAAAEDILKRMLTLDPGNGYVLLLRGKAALESDDPKAAIGYLEKAPDIDSHPDGLRDLLKAYLQTGNTTKAAPIAEKLLSVHNDSDGLFLLAEACSRLGQHHEALDIYTRHADRLLGTDSSKLLSSLHSMISQVRDDSGGLDSLLLLLNKAGESTHVNEVTELLAHSSVKDGNLERARDLYQMLATTEPQNQLHMQNYQQVVQRINEASPSTGITAEEGAVIVEELEATAPVIDQSYPDAIAIAVRSAVTDADLFLSYNLPDKAIVPLLGALPQAPRDARLNQRLAALHTRYQRFTEAAVCCRTLESVYHDAGFPDEAARYGELAERYEQSAATTQPILPAATKAPAASPAAGSTVVARPAAKPAARAAAAAPWPTATPTAPAHEAAPAGGMEFGMVDLSEPASEPEIASSAVASDLTSELTSHHSGHDSGKALETSSEISAEASDSNDLSSEWESSLSVDESAPAAEASEEIEINADADADADASSNPEIAETVEEVRFYLEHFMTDQARAGLEKLELLTTDSRILDPLRAALASGAPLAEPEADLPEINADADEPVEYGLEMAAQNDPGNVAGADLLAGYHQPTPHESEDAINIDTDIAEPAEEVAPAPAKPARREATRPEPKFSQPQVTQPKAKEPKQPKIAEPVHAEPVHAASAQAEPTELTSFVADLEASLGDSFPEAPPLASQPSAKPLAGWPTSPAPKKPAAPAPPPRVETPVAPPAPAIAASTSGHAAAAAPAMTYSTTPVRPLGSAAQTASPSDSVDLSEMFGELKQELEEDVKAGDEDPETHYNLGVAFREMGLLDEAIAELQKVCTSIERGVPFSQPVQTYTWLAQCFLDKGVPQAAIRWYEKALSIPGLDDEAKLAINYELGSACETAQDKPAALRHFTAVYGANIDYRDVAERIQALKS